MAANSVSTTSAETHEVPLEECEVRVGELQELVAHLSTGSTNAAAVSEAIHEVAQPVTAATHFLVVAQKLLSSSDPAANDRGLEAIRSAQQCLTRTGEVMTSVKSTAETNAFKPSPQDLRTMLDDALRLFELDANMVPSIKISPKASHVMGDRVQLGQVIANLIRNALEATEGQALRRLNITARKSAKLVVEIRIEDNGPGLSDKMDGLLFTAFSTTKKDGVGVGLSICRTIVEQHQGRIWADSLPAGIAFCFTLPSCPETSIKHSRRGPPRAPKKPRSHHAKLPD